MKRQSEKSGWRFAFYYEFIVLQLVRYVRQPLRRFHREYTDR